MNFDMRVSLFDVSLLLKERSDLRIEASAYANLPEKGAIGGKCLKLLKKNY